MKHASLQYTKRKACLVAHRKSRVYIILCKKNSKTNYSEKKSLQRLREAVSKFSWPKILHKVMLASILAEKFRGSRLTFLLKMLSGETLCKLPQIANCLYFLAGKLRHFEQLLLVASKNKFKENWRMRILSTPYFFHFFWREN